MTKPRRATNETTPAATLGTSLKDLLVAPKRSASAPVETTRNVVADLARDSRSEHELIVEALELWLASNPDDARCAQVAEIVASFTNAHKG